MTAVARTKENLEHCKCLNCPSYSFVCKIKSMPGNMYKLMDDLSETDHFEGMYCAFEKSRCIHEDHGCMCNSCEIHHKYNLKREDYCLSDGGIKEQSSKTQTTASATKAKTTPATKNKTKKAATTK